MTADEEARLVDKLRKIEALFASTRHAGEREAADNARERILQRLGVLQAKDPPIEFRFSMPDAWSRNLFIALLRCYNLKPYRYTGQRRTTVMTKVTRSFVDEILWPEFQELQATLSAHLEAITQRVIASATHGDGGEVEERSGKELGMSGH